MIFALIIRSEPKNKDGRVFTYPIIYCKGYYSFSKSEWLKHLEVLSKITPDSFYKDLIEILDMIPDKKFPMTKEKVKIYNIKNPHPSVLVYNVVLEIIKVGKRE